jgi:fructose-1,6-bisphosphatase/inositol monophosphatase family enzyme
MNSAPTTSPQLAAALEAARAADAVIAPLFRSNLAVEIKADRSPVTEADRRGHTRRVVAAFS